MEASLSKEKPLPIKVILVGVGGASCSGKTTLAKHLRSVLRNSFIVHQDDFAPPEQIIPVHPIHKVQDWDDPEGAIDWPRLASFLKRVREEGGLPSDYKSHDGLNKQIKVPISQDLASSWAQKFLDIQENAKKSQGIDIVWGLVDGFLLYWHPDVVHELDVRLFLRVSYDILKARRDERFGYHTAEGSLWQDPPGYWDDIVWPAYLKAHKNIFVGGDVSFGEAVVVGEEQGVEQLVNGLASRSEEQSSNDDRQRELAAHCGKPVPRLTVLPAESLNMDGLFSAACGALVEAA